MRKRVRQRQVNAWDSFESQDVWCRDVGVGLLSGSEGPKGDLRIFDSDGGDSGP